MKLTIDQSNFIECYKKYRRYEYLTIDEGISRTVLFEMESSTKFKIRLVDEDFKRHQKYGCPYCKDKLTPIQVFNTVIHDLELLELEGESSEPFIASWEYGWQEYFKENNIRLLEYALLALHTSNFQKVHEPSVIEGVFGTIELAVEEQTVSKIAKTFTLEKENIDKIRDIIFKAVIDENLDKSDIKSLIDNLQKKYNSL